VPEYCPQVEEKRGAWGAGDSVISFDEARRVRWAN
jgi:hypothetical protein